ncbi:MAG TPA: 30S ribosome-binding factor RbfA [Desulfomonilaceae bacterium]|nr:30S ribosome-binding factor RbfA [Desulfomonilaceae bacterium]
MPSFRKDRVSELLLQAISEIVVLKIKDPRVQGVTITEVRMSGDLKSASVYFSSLTDGKGEDHKKGLENAAGFIRRQLRSELDLKYIPELSFFYDTSFDNFSRIDRLLKQLEPKSEDEC